MLSTGRWGKKKKKRRSQESFVEWHHLHAHCTNLPSQQLCSVPGRRCPHTGTMNALQLKPIVRRKLCLLPASPAKARCSTWQSLLRAATAQRALCTHRKHTQCTHNAHTHTQCTHTQPCMQEQAAHNIPAVPAQSSPSPTQAWPHRSP